MVSLLLQILFSNVRQLIRTFSRGERITILIALVILVGATFAHATVSFNDGTDFTPVQGGSYVEGIVGQPIAINPIISANQTDHDIASLIYSSLGDLLFIVERENNDRSYLVKLYDGLLWHDGEPLTSDDVLFTIRTVQDIESRSPFAKAWQGVVAERVSELQIKLTLPTPYAFFEKNFENLPIIPQHIFGSVPVQNLGISTFNLEPIGSGPYKFNGLSKRRDGFITHYQLVTNELYHGNAPFINRFEFRFYENMELLITDLSLRRIDGTGMLIAPDKNITSLSHVAVEAIPMPRYYGVFFNSLGNGVLKNDSLRRGLSRAIDKVALTDQYAGTSAFPMSGLLTPSLADTIDEEMGQEIRTAAQSLFDVEEARKDVETARNKEKLEKISLTITVPDNAFLIPIAESIARAWERVGIDKVTVTPIHARDFTAEIIRTRNYEILLFGNVLENPEDLFPFWHSSQRFYPGLNLSLYADATVDKAIEESRQNSDIKNRRENLERAAEIIESDYPAVFLFSLPYFYIHTTKLGGISASLIATPDDRFAHIEQWYVRKVRTIKEEE